MTRAYKDAPVVSVAGEPVQPRTRTVRGGLQLTVTIQEPEGSLTVEVGAGKGRARWSLALATTQPEPALAEADTLRFSGKFAEALARVRPLLKHTSAEVRAAALAKKGRILFAMGEPSRAMATMRESIRVQSKLGRLSAEALDRFALSYYLNADGRFADARAALEPVRRFEAQHPAAGVMRYYYESIVALDYGDLREAHALQLLTMAGAEKLGLTRYHTDAMNQHIALLHKTGRYAEAQPLIEELAHRIPAEEGCRRAEILHNVGWYRLAARQAHAAGEAPLPALQEAAALYGRSCPTPRYWANGLVNLARGHLDAGQIEAANAALSEAKRVDPEPDAYNALDRLRLAADLQLAQQGFTAALEAYTHLEELALGGDYALFRWHSALGRGRVHQSQHRWPEAAAAYAEAEALVEERLLATPLGEGRDTSAAVLSASAEHHVDVLLRMGKKAEAAEAARRSRRRVLGTLEWTSRVARMSPTARTKWYEAVARYRSTRAVLEAKASDDWTLSKPRLSAALAARHEARTRMAAALDGALSALQAADPRSSDRRLLAPEPDEVLLVYHPLPEGWAGFAIDAKGVVSTRGAPIDRAATSNALADALLAPFAARIRAARKIKILAHGGLQWVDFHALPWRGQPLLVSKPVAYGADLPRRPKVKGEPTDALVIANPDGSLPAAHEEAAVVDKALKARGLRVHRLEGAHATFREVYDRLDSGAIHTLHYAGHAQHSGRDGQGSAIKLHGGAELSITDILSLSRAPKYVVLSSCSGGAAHEAGNVQSLAIAHAFLLAGTEQVLAATRAIRDQEALELVRGAYAGIELTQGESVRATQARLAKETTSIDWASIRIIAP